MGPSGRGGCGALRCVRPRRLGSCADYRWSDVEAAAARAERIEAFHKRQEGVGIEGLVGRGIGSSFVCQLTVEGKSMWAVSTGRATRAAERTIRSSISATQW